MSSIFGLILSLHIKGLNFFSDSASHNNQHRIEYFLPDSSFLNLADDMEMEVHDNLSGVPGAILMKLSGLARWFIYESSSQSTQFHRNWFYSDTKTLHNLKARNRTVPQLRTNWRKKLDVTREEAVLIENSNWSEIQNSPGYQRCCIGNMKIVS